MTFTFSDAEIIEIQNAVPEGWPAAYYAVTVILARHFNSTSWQDSWYTNPTIDQDIRNVGIWITGASDVNNRWGRS